MDGMRRDQGGRVSARWGGRLVTALAAGCASGPESPERPPDGGALFVEADAGRIGTDGGATRGVAWADFDQDGDPDLATANTAGQWNALYLNTASGPAHDWRAASATAPEAAPAATAFVKATDPAVSPLGAVASAGGAAEGVAWVDYDGDGDLDLHMVTRGEQPDLLFDNLGPEGLRRVNEGPLAAVASHTMACWADADGDGWLDVFIVGYRSSGNAFLRNLGQGRFEGVEGAPAEAGTGTGRACAWGDLDDDGLPDLYVGNAQQANELYRNRGGFRFERVLGPMHIVTHAAYTYGVSWADFDEDGDQDLFAANFDDVNALYRNTDGLLEPLADDPIATETGGASKGHAWGDYDLDGDLDLFVANGTYGPDMRNFLFLNRGDGRFERDRRGVLDVHGDTSAGAAWADFDGDGDLDVFVANWGSSDQQNRLYRNTAERLGHQWVAFRLRSPTANSHGWAAKVRVRVPGPEGGRWLTRWNTPTTGYGSQNDLLAHFGLGAATGVDSLVVVWTSGRVDRSGPLSAGRVWTVHEGGRVEPPTERNASREP